MESKAGFSFVAPGVISKDSDSFGGVLGCLVGG